MKKGIIISIFCLALCGCQDNKSIKCSMSSIDVGQTRRNDIMFKCKNDKITEGIDNRRIVYSSAEEAQKEYYVLSMIYEDITLEDSTIKIVNDYTFSFPNNIESCNEMIEHFKSKDWKCTVK